MSTIRTLVLTDVVDSTVLSTRLGDARMAEVWAAHDRVARDLVRQCGGREIDKTDGMLMLFDAVADALRFALAYRRALGALEPPLAARIGVHVGPVILRENSAADVAQGAKPLEVDGLAKPITARVMAIAGADQILLTPEACAALGPEARDAGESAAAGATGALQLHSHGHWMVKGLDEPIELFEAAEAESDAGFALPPDGDKAYRVVRVGSAWMPVRQFPNNLPLQADSFVGRAGERREVKALLAGTRLLTLVGMGGLGKTRLALQVAADLMTQFADGTWFLDLAPIRDPQLLVGEVAQVLGVREDPGRSLLQTLCAALRPQRCLLLLDNCEHVVGTAAALVQAILAAAPGVRILATSRETLRVAGELTYPVPPLPLPSAGADLPALERSTAVRLFVDRARAHRPGFALSVGEAAAVVELVVRLEGIPLALELAAARLRALSVADINQRLKDRYKLLTGGGRVRLERQQTLRALVDWSYELLNDAERTLFDRLAVFVGGFDLAAAEQVCSAQPLQRDDLLDLVGSLVDKSLLLRQQHEEGSRYRMLETLRDYARARLAQRDDAAATAVRHCEHFFVLAKATRNGLKGEQQALWIRRGEADLDNIRSAIALALALAPGGGVDAFTAVKFAVAMMAFWILRGYSSEGRGIVRAAMALPAVQASDMAHAHAAYVGAALAQSQSDHAEARALLQTCLALRRRLGDPVDLAATLSTLSLAQLQAGDAVAAQASESEALALFRAQGEKLGEALGLLHLGQIALHAGDDAQVRQHLAGSLAIARSLGHREIEGEAELALGASAWLGGPRQAARGHLERSLAVCRDAADRRGEAHALWWLGKCELDAGDPAAARERLGQALRTFRAFEMREAMLGCLEDHALLAQHDGQAAVAVQLAAAVAEMRERLALRRSPRAESIWAECFGPIRRGLPEAAFEQAWQQGRGGEIEGALRLALAPPA